MTVHKLISLALITALILPTSLKAGPENERGEQSQHPILPQTKVDLAEPHPSNAGSKPACQTDTEQLRAENNTLKNKNRALAVQNDTLRQTLNLVLACLITESVFVVWGFFTGALSIKWLSQN